MVLFSYIPKFKKKYPETFGSFLMVLFGIVALILIAIMAIIQTVAFVVAMVTIILVLIFCAYCIIASFNHEKHHVTVSILRTVGMEETCNIKIIGK